MTNKNNVVFYSSSKEQVRDAPEVLRQLGLQSVATQHPETVASLVAETQAAGVIVDLDIIGGLIDDQVLKRLCSELRQAVRLVAILTGYPNREEDSTLPENPDEIAQWITGIWRKEWQSDIRPCVLILPRMGVKCMTIANELGAANDQLGLSMLSKLILEPQMDQENLSDALLAKSQCRAEIDHYFATEFIQETASSQGMVMEPLTNKALRFEEPLLLSLLSIRSF